MQYVIHTLSLGHDVYEGRKDMDAKNKTRTFRLVKEFDKQTMNEVCLLLTFIQIQTFQIQTYSTNESKSKIKLSYVL